MVAEIFCSLKPEFLKAGNGRAARMGHRIQTCPVRGGHALPFGRRNESRYEVADLALRIVLPHACSWVYYTRQIVVHCWI